MATATRWCVASVDRAVGRLSTEIARMDAIDLAAPWVEGVPARSERITALALEMGHVVVAGDAKDGRRLADALGRAWAAHRLELQRRGSAAQPAALELLEQVQMVHVALGASVDARDVRGLVLAAS